ncbi:Nuclear receptor domain-containing protein [Aphelenchoides besseyi]|nr:Nuclear receptor domain-containing protein [Aphelenchoides besseyi]KAI6193090.1 Nuclear receptor domain-containing protein [Aphelenchoides besseyi]
MSMGITAPGSVESMESTPSTSNESVHDNSSAHSPSSAGTCPVCGDSAWNRHFGVVSCNACAAFFRRTVALRKSYICVRGKNCDVTQDSARHLCKFCRFQNCILHGMCIGAVFTRPPQNDFNAFEETALLRKLLECRNAVFVDRFNATIKVNNGRQEAVHLGRKQPTATHTIRAVQAEFIVMTSCLRQCGLRQMGVDGLELSKLGACLFYQWVCFNCIAGTLRNGGHNLNEAFFVDESHIPVNFDSVKSYVETFKDLVDPKYVVCAELTEEQIEERWNEAALLSFRFCRAIVNAAIKLHKARLDDTEFAVMSQMMTLKMATRIFPDNENLRRYMNILFETMRHHYESNFDDTAVRLGNLILLSNEIETVTFAFEESIVALNGVGYEPVLTQILRSQLFAEQIFNTASNLTINEQASINIITDVC